MSKKPTVLMILDGFGLNDKTEGNAKAQANTPTIDKLMNTYPFVEGYASGLAVGLPDGQFRGWPFEHGGRKDCISGTD